MLINADDGKFSYAGIFCGLSTIIGVAIAVAPVATEWFRGSVLGRTSSPDLAEKGVGGEGGDGGEGGEGGDGDDSQRSGDETAVGGEDETATRK